MTAKPINEEVLSKEFEQLRNDFPSFLKQPVEEGLLPPRDWMIQQIKHSHCEPGKEAALVPLETYVTILRGTESDELRARKIAARAKAGVLDRLERLLLIGGLHPRGDTLNGLFSLPGDPPLSKKPGQGVWDFCEEAINSYRNGSHYDSSFEKPLSGEGVGPGLILIIYIKRREKIKAQAGAHKSCEIDAASGQIKLNGVRVLGSDIIDDDKAMVVPRSICSLILCPDLKYRFSGDNLNSVVVNFSANVLFP